MSADFAVHKKHNLKALMVVALCLLVCLPILFFASLFVGSFINNAKDATPRDVNTTEIQSSAARISWISDRKVQSIVEYGTSPAALNSYAPETTEGNEHSVDLTLLTSATTYYFQIKSGDTTYDNNGMPWTFTTKSDTGEDVSATVRGIYTRIEKKAEANVGKTNKATPLVCDGKTCSEIQDKLGRGCTVRDYVQCLGLSPTSGVVAGTSTSVYSPTPHPTGIQIKSSYCKLDFLQSDPNSTYKCTRWTWDSMNTKTAVCSKAFDRYILECKNRSFESDSGDDFWYFKGAIEEISSTSATLNSTPSIGTTVHCRLRAEDAVGGSDEHATSWVNASRKCE